MRHYIKAQMLSPSRRREYEPENRFKDQDGREHYDNGRFAPMGAWDGGWQTQMRYPMSPYVPPVYEYQTRREKYQPMNRIGFFVSDEEERSPSMHGGVREYHSDAEYRRMHELDRMGGAGLSEGYGRGYGRPTLTREMAEEWTANMENEDGTRGPHWPFERIQKEMEQHGVKCDPVKFWAVINAIYSDDVAVAKKHGVNTMEYYIDRTKAWLEDKDAVQDKVGAYYMYVVEHR